MRPRYRAVRDKRQEELIRAADERAYKNWKAQYDAYLRSPEWAQRRQLVLMRAQGICEGCRAARATDVHHTTYVHAGEEFLFELVALCPACHSRYHDTTKLRYAQTIVEPQKPNQAMQRTAR